MAKHKVVFLNPRTCGIYKNGAPRYKTDPATGLRTQEIDNELMDAVQNYVKGKKAPDYVSISLGEIYKRHVLVPTYYDNRFNKPINRLFKSLSVKGVSLGKLLDKGVLEVHPGHGSPGNDQRTGHIPYVKVSDIRGLRINVNPTNLVSTSVASRFWRGDSSGLKAWDVITPNRASSNIGEFAILLPGEENVVLTKEVFVFRVSHSNIWDPFYLLWAFCLRAVREQWRRIALMQTNREDCGDRYLEIILPDPPTRKWARERSKAFRDYFTRLAKAKDDFVSSVSAGDLEYIASVLSISPDHEIEDDQIIKD